MQVPATPPLFASCGKSHKPPPKEQCIPSTREEYSARPQSLVRDHKQRIPSLLRLIYRSPVQNKIKDCASARQTHILLHAADRAMTNTYIHAYDQVNCHWSPLTGLWCSWELYDCYRSANRLCTGSAVCRDMCVYYIVYT